MTSADLGGSAAGSTVDLEKVRRLIGKLREFDANDPKVVVAENVELAALLLQSARYLPSLIADLEAARAENQRLKGNLERLLRKPDNSITMTLAEYDAMTAELAQARARIAKLEQAVELTWRAHEKSTWSVVVVMEWARAKRRPPNEWAPAAKELWTALAALDAAQEPSGSQ